MTRLASVALVLLVGCSSSDSTPVAAQDAGADLAVSDALDSPSDPIVDSSPESQGDSLAEADWVIRLQPSSPGPLLPATLLGHYDLSGALYHFDEAPNLLESMKQIGFSEWRVGVGRWENVSLLFPTLTDGTSCAAELAALPVEAQVPEGWTDLDLLKARDWFTWTDGTAVTEEMTNNDDRYNLAYVRSVIDQAVKFGASPYVDIDLMPRALAINSTPSRVAGPIPDPCLVSFTNHVSNARPADANVFAAAAVGLVRRIVEGSGGEPPRAVKYWELWNEPEFPYFWDRSFEPGGNLDEFFKMAVLTLYKLATWREASSNPNVQQLRFGFGSFALGDTAAAVIKSLDTTEPVPGTHTPVDFFSFHAYDNDPLVIAEKVASVAAARDASTNYKQSELVLAEWGPSLAGGYDHLSMDVPLLTTTVLALGAAAGLSHAHRALIYEYFDGLPLALVDHSGKPKPGWYGYSLLASLFGEGARRLPPLGREDGRLDQGNGAVLASVDGTNQVRVLLVNRAASPKRVAFEVGGLPVTPSALQLFDNPTQPPHAVPSSAVFTLPARSLALADL